MDAYFGRRDAKENWRTPATPDGFTVSFSLTEELSQELGRAHLEGGGHRAKAH
jgi:hypothetical protein